MYKPKLVNIIIFTPNDVFVREIQTPYVCLIKIHIKSLESKSNI